MLITMHRGACEREVESKRDSVAAALFDTYETRVYFAIPDTATSHRWARRLGKRHALLRRTAAV